jgi:hypothetical protein
LSYSIESYYKDTPYLQVDILDQSIPPDRVGAILITFNPLQPKSYREIIDLLVNGKYLETLKVSGKGVELKVSTEEELGEYRACLVSAS